MAKKAVQRYRFEPDYAVPPGETLLETIEALNMSQAELALRTRLARKTVNLIIKGKEPITFGTAIKLERATGVPARMWNNLEMNYREQLAKIRDRERLQADLDWLKEIPVRELIKRGVIPANADKSEQLRGALKFFAVESVQAWRELWRTKKIAARKSLKFAGQPGPTATWIRLGEVESQQLTCAPYNKTKFKKVIRTVRKMTADPPTDFGKKIKVLCAECGVAVVFVRRIKNAPWSGASWWDSPTKAVIELNLRYRTDDQFWFSFFHEAGHILLAHSKKELFINAGRDSDPREQEANEFAASFLIPPEFAGELVRLGGSEANIKGFAENVGISPGIVVGRMQKEGLIAWQSRLNHLKGRMLWDDE